jgi:hypothetical protein
MNKVISILAMTLAFSAPAFAQGKKIEVIPESANFSGVNVDTMAAGTVYFQFTANPPPFSEWITRPEAEFLNLYENFKEPETLTRRRKQRVTEKMTIYMAKAKTVINKPSVNIKLQDYVSVDFMRRLDPELKHGPITPQQTMPVVAGQPNLPNFQALCNSPTDKFIERPARELSMAESQRPGEAWCANTSRSVCVESCLIFSDGYQKFAKFYNTILAKDDFDKKDRGMASQSELRFFVSEAEWGKRKPVATITGINTPVRGVLEQNMFYFNQLVIYGKVIAIFQEHPKDASKTIVTSLLVFGMQSSTFDKAYGIGPVSLGVKDILMGNGGEKLNTPTGITSGLPKYTQTIAKTLAEILEK